MHVFPLQALYWLYGRLVSQLQTACKDNLCRWHGLHLIAGDKTTLALTETFYRDFKHTLRATCWHCRTPTTFHQELLMHMIALCLIRIAMLEASRLVNLSVGQLSFARALTETRLFFKILLSSAQLLLWPCIWEQFVRCCSRHRVLFKPNRQFPRDRQQYRRKSRGLEQRPRGRKPKYSAVTANQPGRETLTDSKGDLYLLS